MALIKIKKISTFFALACTALILILASSTHAISTVESSIYEKKLTLTYDGAPPFFINIRSDSEIGKAGGYVWAATYSKTFVIDMSFADNPSGKFYYGIKDATGWSPVNAFSLGSSEYIPKYTLQWSEEFKDENENWNDADWTFETNKCEFRKGLAELNSGKLILKIINKNEEDMGRFTEKPCWGSEYFSADKYFYGKYAVKMKPNSPQGVVTSFFLFDKAVDSSGKTTDWYEIDIEFPGRTDKVQYNVRWMEEGKEGVQDDKHLVDLGFDASQDFHEYIIEWAEDHISFYVDGNLSYTYTDFKVIEELSQPMGVHMNYWVSDSEIWAGRFNEGTLPITAEYESAEYYKLDNK